MTDLLVVGAGLLGTSIAMALRSTHEVLLTDPDPVALNTATERSGGRAWDGVTQPALVVIAVPLGATAAVLARHQRLMPDVMFTHVASAQSQVQADIESLTSQTATVCGGHPMAGRELSGPGAAREDLFVGRPWVLCPSTATAAPVLEAVRALALACGAEPLERTAAQHDADVALVSHLPQLVSSALAARLLAAPSSTGLAGPGLQDTTRIAGSPVAMWLDVLQANGARVAPLLHAVAEDLTRTAGALEDLASGRSDAQSHGDRQQDSTAAARLHDLLERGRSGRALVPLKRGRADTDFVTVSTEVSDRPGTLAFLLVTAGEAGVNVEDIRVDHLPGRPRGRVDLLVRRGQQGLLRAALTAAGVAVLPEP